jgi:predicted nucleotide-binding protein
MAKINQRLLQRIKEKLGVSTLGAVYDRIHKTGREHGIVHRDLAALRLGWELGISPQKYATGEQLTRLDRMTGSPGRSADQTQAVVQPARKIARKTKSGKIKKTVSNSVFVVHGRDEALRKSMFAFLRALSLVPIEWEQAVHEAKGANPDIKDIIETSMMRGQAVVVLFSPDEIAYLKEHLCGADDKKTEGKPAGQARPNVIFEAGLALGAHPEKTVIVQVGKVRPFSDIAGKHLVRLSDEPGKRNDLANRLSKIGCDVNKIGNDWLTAGTFDPSEPKAKGQKRRASSS